MLSAQGSRRRRREKEGRTMRRIALTVAVYLAFGLTGFSQGSADRVTVIRAGRVLDPATGQTQQNVVIVVRGNRIEAIGPGVSAPANAPVVDLTGYTVLPTPT
jgi:hypothetical protein